MPFDPFFEFYCPSLNEKMLNVRFNHSAVIYINVQSLPKVTHLVCFPQKYVKIMENYETCIELLQEGNLKTDFIRKKKKKTGMKCSKENSLLVLKIKQGY